MHHNSDMEGVGAALKMWLYSYLFDMLLQPVSFELLKGKKVRPNLGFCDDEDPSHIYR